MKKIITLALSVVAMLTSCQKEEIGANMNPTTNQVTINITADDAVETRAASTAPTRYIVEVYSDATYTTPANIFGAVAAETNQTTVTPTNGSASLTLAIDRTKNYYFLFWSDVNGADTYTTTSLKAVTLKSTKSPVESWSGKAQILAGAAQPTLAVTLTRAVAKINLMENYKILANSSLVMTFDQPTAFNVATGTVGTLAARTETVTNAGAIDGTATAVKLNSEEIYLFATQVAEAQTVLDKITFKMGEEDAFEVTSVPLEANKATNITGHYTQLASETFTAGVDENWATPDNDKPLAVTGTYKIGDTYPKGGTTIGVVYSISNGGVNGLVVSLTEGTDKNWGDAKTWAGAHNAGGKTWHCPTKDELKLLYTSTSYSDWTPAPNNNTKTAVNKTLESISGSTQLSDNRYWSSTEDSNGDGAWRVNFTNGGTRSGYELQESNKSELFKVRAVLAF